MPIEEIREICFIGAGTMGTANALVAALAGYEAVLYDAAPESLERVPARQREMAAYLIDSGLCTQEEASAAAARVTCTGDLATATADADLVSESVFEKLTLKRDIHRRLDALCPPKTILTTNTSALLVSEIEDVVGRGERFAALHSHLGAPLVDIVGGPRTSRETIDILRRYVVSIRGVPLVLKKEHPGYVLNAMLGAVLTTAMMLVIRGAATPDDVDRAWMIHVGAPMGPFGMMDLFGLDVVLDSWSRERRDESSKALQAAVLAFLRPRVQRGELGVKSGKGFYDYPDPHYQQTGFLEAGTDTAAAAHAMVCALIRSAVEIAAEDVAEPAEIDLAWRVATKLDLGPFGLLREAGVARFREELGPELLAWLASRDTDVDPPPVP